MSGEGQRYPNDRSRNGHLVHAASSSGRIVTVIAYLESGTHPIGTTIMCRTTEQAAAVAQALNVAPNGEASSRRAAGEA